MKKIHTSKFKLLPDRECGVQQFFVFTFCSFFILARHYVSGGHKPANYTNDNASYHQGGGMQTDGEGRFWVRIYLSSREELMNTQNIDGVELFRASLRVIDQHNLVIDGYLPEKIYAKLRQLYRIRVLGDVEQEIGKAATYVSKTNRYRKL